MTTHYENDLIQLLEPVTADVVGEGRTLAIAAGTTGAVVLVHGDPKQPSAYEIEFYIQEQDCYALATIDAGNL